MLCGQFLKPPKPPVEPLHQGAGARASRGWRAATPARWTWCCGTSCVTLVVFLGDHGAGGRSSTPPSPTGFFPQQDTGFLSGVMLTSQDASFTKTEREDRSRSPQVIAPGPRRRRRRLLRRQRRRQPGQHVHQPQAARTSGRKAQRRPDHHPAAAQARPAGRRADLPAGGAGHQRRRPRRPGAVPVHPVAIPTSTSSTPGRRSCWRRMQSLPQLKDVSSDQQSQGAAVNLTIDRDAAARFGIAPADIDAAIYDLIGQRRGGPVFHPAEQPTTWSWRRRRTCRRRRRSVQLGLSAVAADRQDRAAVAVREGRSRTRTSSLTISHQGEFPAATLSFNLAPGVSLGQATKAVRGRARQAGRAAQP